MMVERGWGRIAEEKRGREEIYVGREKGGEGEEIDVGERNKKLPLQFLFRYTRACVSCVLAFIVACGI